MLNLDYQMREFKSVQKIHLQQKRIYYEQTFGIPKQTSAAQDQ